MKRQLLYSFVYLAWTAILLSGVLYFAHLHVTIGGILTLLWVLSWLLLVFEQAGSAQKRR